jgi:C4-dicarboxylate-specific signal transduction histidine kinase
MSSAFSCTYDSAPDGVDVEALLLRVCERSRERAEALGVGLIVECGGGVLDLDGVALEDILANLVGNAIESTPSGQSVRLDTRVTDAGDQLWTIRHASPGTPARVMLSAATTMRIGGSMAFESSEKDGTTIRLLLPCEERDGDSQTVSFRVRPVESAEFRDSA